MPVLRVVDLSVPLGPGTQVYPGDPEVRLEAHATVHEDGFNLLRVAMGSQSGTHVDAPFHVDDGGARLDALPLGRFVGPGVVVDGTGVGERGAIGWEVLAPYADRFGPGVVVLIRTDWSARYGTPAYLDHPSLDPDACRRLLGTGVRTIGIDAPSVDPTGSAADGAASLPAHHLVARAGGVIAENLTGLGAVDFPDPLVVLLPVPLEGADGAPVRAVALQVGQV